MPAFRAFSGISVPSGIQPGTRPVDADTLATQIAAFLAALDGGRVDALKVMTPADPTTPWLLPGSTFTPSTFAGYSQITPVAWDISSVKPDGSYDLFMKTWIGWSPTAPAASQNVVGLLLSTSVPAVKAFCGLPPGIAMAGPTNNLQARVVFNVAPTRLPTCVVNYLYA